MSAKKGQNNFKKMQEEKVKKNTIKIEKAIASLPKHIEKVTLSKVIRLVAKDAGIHFTTINKNELYYKMCNDHFLTMSLIQEDKKKKSSSVEEQKIRLLKLEIANLNNQVTGLKNVVARLEENGGQLLEDNSNDDYKAKFEAILNHFEEQLEVKDGQVVDPYSGIRPVLICKL